MSDSNKLQPGDIVIFRKDTYWYQFNNGVYADRLFQITHRFNDDDLVNIKALSQREDDPIWIRRGGSGGFLPGSLAKI